MARGDPLKPGQGKGGKFVKGHKLAKGKPRTPKDLLEARSRFTATFVEGMLAKYMEKSLEDLMQIQKDLQAKKNLGKMTAFEGLIASIVIKALIDGDTTRLDFILNRTVGTIAKKHEVKNEEPSGNVQDKLNLIPAEKIAGLLKEAGEEVIEVEAE